MGFMPTLTGLRWRVFLQRFEAISPLPDLQLAAVEQLASPSAIAAPRRDPVRRRFKPTVLQPTLSRCAILPSSRISPNRYCASTLPSIGGFPQPRHGLARRRPYRLPRADCGRTGVMACIVLRTCRHQEPAHALFNPRQSLHQSRSWPAPFGRRQSPASARRCNASRAAGPPDWPSETAFRKVMRLWLCRRVLARTRPRFRRSAVSKWSLELARSIKFRSKPPPVGNARRRCWG